MTIPAVTAPDGVSSRFAPSAFSSAASGVIAATTTSASRALVATDRDMRVYNAGTTIAFIRWGIGAQTAVATDVAVPPGTVHTFNKGNADTVAVIMASATANIYVSTGFGS
jgi:hypothetical protein